MLRPRQTTGRSSQGVRKPHWVLCDDEAGECETQAATDTRFFQPDGTHLSLDHAVKPARSKNITVVFSKRDAIGLELEATDSSSFGSRKKLVFA